MMSSRTASLALLAGLMCAAPAAALAAPAPTPAHAERTRAASPAHATPVPVPAAREDAARYADREARSGRVADYQGGSFVIVISGGALLVALLIALILI